MVGKWNVSIEKIRLVPDVLYPFFAGYSKGDSRKTFGIKSGTQSRAVKEAHVILEPPVHLSLCKP